MALITKDKEDKNVISSEKEDVPDASNMSVCEGKVEARKG